MIIVQPATTERITSGVAFTPYWLYAARKKLGLKVELVENATLVEWDEVMDHDVVVDLSTYPQIDFALQAQQEGRRRGHRVQFIGYEPLIKALNLPLYNPVPGLIQTGVESYLDCIDDYKYGLRVDCDHHIKKAVRDRPVVPMFLSVGCKRACPYCYVSVSNYPQAVLSWEKIESLLELCVENKWDVHFTDENFFYNPYAEQIVDWLYGMDIRWTCLTDTIALARAIKDHGEAWLLDTGNICNEVGLETANKEALASKAQELDTLTASNVEVLWLTMTFLPYDTLTGLNRTGEFLKEYGHGRGELVQQMDGTSMHGGLGQFMQLYHGTKYYKQRRELGKCFSERGVRLWPSFIGHRMLSGVPVRVRDPEPEDRAWFDLYVGEEKVMDTFGRIDGRTSFEQAMNGNDLQAAVALAQLARLGVITDKETDL